MIKEEVITEKKTIKTITCDFCGKQSPYIYSPVKACQICERDVCPHCAVELDFPICDLLKPGYTGDHSDYVCKSCWEKGKTIRQEIMKVRDKADEQEGELIKQWENLCHETGV